MKHWIITGLVAVVMFAAGFWTAELIVVRENDYLRKAISEEREDLVARDLLAFSHWDFIDQDLLTFDPSAKPCFIEVSYSSFGQPTVYRVEGSGNFTIEEQNQDKFSTHLPKEATAAIFKTFLTPKLLNYSETAVELRKEILENTLMVYDGVQIEVLISAPSLQLSKFIYADNPDSYLEAYPNIPELQTLVGALKTFQTHLEPHLPEN